MKFIWRKINIWLWKETTRGTVSTTPVWLPKTDLSFEEKIKTINDESSVWNIVDATDSIVINKTWEWDIWWIVEANSIWNLFLALFWIDTVDNPETWVYIHKFELSNSNTIQSYSIFVNDPVLWSKTYPLATLENLTITFETGSYIKYKASFKSKTEEASTESVSYDVELSKFNASNNIRLFYADNYSDLINDTATDICSKSFEITFNKNLEEDFCLGNITPVDYINKQFSVEWSFTWTYKDNNLRDIIMNWDKKAIWFVISDWNTVLWTNHHPKLQIQLALASFTEFNRTQWNNEVVSQTCKFKWLYSKNDWLLWGIVLTNSTESY